MSGTPNHMISEIKLPEEMSNSYTVFDQKSEDGQRETIPYLSKVNLFIGANNSGKSRFLRGVFAPRNLQYRDIFGDWSNVSERYNSFYYTYKRSGDHFGNYDDVIKEIETRKDQLLFLTMNGDYKTLLEEFIEFIQNSIFNPDEYGRSHYPEAAEFIKVLSGHLASWHPMDIASQVTNYHRIYIPTLRGLRPRKEKLIDGAEKYQKYRSDDFYRERTSEDYFMLTGGKFSFDIKHQDIFTGLNMFEKVFERLLGNEVDRNLIKEFEGFLSEKFFEGRGISLLPKKDSDVLSVKLGNEEFPIYELGDGIQQLITMTFPIFLHQENNLFLLIEEPELYLHPGMQRQLMEILLDTDRFPNVQTFVTTHSNHLLDLTLDLDNISVFRFEKEHSDDPKNPKFNIHSTHNEDVQLLQSLGVRTSSVFLSNCTIWVEGISDRIYMRKYLKMYQKEMERIADEKGDEFKVFKEDYHFSFIEYGGNNITHWSFLDEYEGMRFDRISNDILLIADQDVGKEERHQALKAKLGDNFQRLDCREIENTLSKDILVKTVKGYLKKGSTFDDEFVEEDYLTDPIGEFIENRISDSSQNSKRGSFKADSGALNKDKAVFARKAVGIMEDYDDLSEEAQKLCKKIYNFIKEVNS
jgi:hypothetical protein